eukprot:Partr_v1_DN27807_c2_g1_i2_m23255 putative ER degradation enhancer, mannosidase alpha-like
MVVAIGTLLCLLLAIMPSSCWGMSDRRRLQLRQTTKEMFYHAYDNYMHHAFPADELSPVRCVAKTRDFDNPLNTGVNDVLGNFSLTLVDSLDMLLILGDHKEFLRAVQLVNRHVHFPSNPSVVQLFETNIRVLGGLLSAHLLATDSHLAGYDGSLLVLAESLGDRLLMAFNSTATGIPHARLSLRDGVPGGETTTTCSAGAGTLLLEFGVLSRLTGDDRFEVAARRALDALWSFRSAIHLVGNVIDIQSGDWLELDTGIGAGVDSLFEYQLKAYILFGDRQFLVDFETAYGAIMKHVLDATGYVYRRVNMYTGNPVTTWVDSLSAFFPGLQVLYGDLGSAIKGWSFFDTLWQRYNGMPERWSVKTHEVMLGFYPLRPEHIESTYLLYQATKDHALLDSGERFVNDLQRFARKPCGFASVRDVTTKANDDRMESFFLSETLKYLYLLFDEDHAINTRDGNLVFTTEGHPLFLPDMGKRPEVATGASNLTCPAVSISLSQSPFVPSPFLVHTHHLQSLYGFTGNSSRRLSATHAMCLREQSSGPKTIPGGADYFVLAVDTVFKPSAFRARNPRLSILDGGDYLLEASTNSHIALTSAADGSGNMRISSIDHRIISNQAFVLAAQDTMMFDHPPVVEVMPVLVRLGDNESFVEVPGLPASFGQPFDTHGEIHGQVAVVAPEANFDGCQEFKSQYRLSDTIVVYRGGCTFWQKSRMAMKGGAGGMIVINNLDDTFQMTEPDEQTRDKKGMGKFHAVMVSSSDGDRLLQTLHGEQVRNSLSIISASISPAPTPVMLTRRKYDDRAFIALEGVRLENLVVLSRIEFDALS